MNTHTGATYELGEDFAEQALVSFHFHSADEFRREAERGAAQLDEVGCPPDATAVRERLGRDLTLDEARALRDQQRGEGIVAVTREVATAQRLGQREVDRRRRRRKAARAARRRNR